MPNRAVEALAFLSLALTVGCSDGKPSEATTGAAPSPLPAAIHGMPLVELTTGADAEAMIRRMHGKDVAPVASYVGQYEGGGAKATLYVSRFANGAVADSVLEAMAQSIGDAGGVFGHHARIAVGGAQVHTVLGQDQVHYFYAQGREVTWLAIDPWMARVGLAGLVGVAAGEVPGEGMLDGSGTGPPAGDSPGTGSPHSGTGPGER